MATVIVIIIIATPIPITVSVTPIIISGISLLI